MVKKCSVCKEEKEESCFRKNNQQRSGLDCQCKDCKKNIESEWRANNRNKIRETQREHYRKNKDIISEKRRISYDPIKAKARWLARKISSEKCVFCDEIGERHHNDYSHPLDIVFLCKSHHKNVHDGTISV